MTKRSKQTRATSTSPRTTSPQPRATSPRPRATGRVFAANPSRCFISTPNGDFTLEQWLALSEFDQYWLRKDKILWPADMRKDA